MRLASYGTRERPEYDTVLSNRLLCQGSRAQTLVWVYWTCWSQLAIEQ